MGFAPGRRLPGLVAGRLLVGSEIGLDLLDARPDLLAVFPARQIQDPIQIGDLLLQVVNVLPYPVSLMNAHFFPHSSPARA